MQKDNMNKYNYGLATHPDVLRLDKKLLEITKKFSFATMLNELVRLALNEHTNALKSLIIVNNVYLGYFAKLVRDGHLTKEDEQLLDDLSYNNEQNTMTMYRDKLNIVIKQILKTIEYAKEQNVSMEETKTLIYDEINRETKKLNMLWRHFIQVLQNDDISNDIINTTISSFDTFIKHIYGPNSNLASLYEEKQEAYITRILKVLAWTNEFLQNRGVDFATMEFTNYERILYASLQTLLNTNDLLVLDNKKVFMDVLRNISNNEDLVFKATKKLN